MKPLTLIFISALFSIFPLTLPAQDFKVNTRYSYYTIEKRAEILVYLPDGEPGQPVTLRIRLDNSTLYESDTVLSGSLMNVSVPIDNLAIGEYQLSVRLINDGKTSNVQSKLVKVLPKANGVQVDRLSGKLIVHGLPWFPFGFYCYSPVQPALAEEEAIKGFNLFSPYQNIEPGTLAQREAYMDRCAQLGMKVHYQLISAAGGGGVGSSGRAKMSGEQKMKRLKSEIEHFRDHPALLAWYLSDEPTGNGVSADSLKKMYDFVRELDPYHPITIVFDAPRRAREYADAMDIVMADPYPIPNGGVEGVGSVTEGLQSVFKYEKPVWIVPQAFGGGEWWGREPSPQEIRAMTYLALVRGATGIQYFIRQGLNGFPKSSVTWGECARIAMEVAEITPFLLDGSPDPVFKKENDGIWTNAWRLGNEVLIMAVNSKNEPRQLKLDIGTLNIDGTVEVLFENRLIQQNGKQIDDWIGALGTQVYRIGKVGSQANGIGSLGKLVNKVSSPESTRNKPGSIAGPEATVTLAGAISEPENELNLISDPGFESMLNYGVPTACYARVGKDRGAGAYLDSRTMVSGNHSLRMVTPADQSGMGLSFFPVSLNSGQSYRFSISSKADTASWLPGKKLTFFQRLRGKKSTVNRDFQVKIGDLADKSFTPSAEWKDYSFYFIVPENSAGQVKINPYLELTGQGTAWFDDMILTEDPVISYSIDPKKRQPQIKISTGTSNATIRYNTDGRKPRVTDPEYVNPLETNKSISVAAGLFRDHELLTWTVRTFSIHLAVGHIPVYEKKFSPGYTAGGSMGLVDGQSGTRNYLDGRWQGFNGQDLKVTIDLDTLRTVSKVSLGFLQNTSAWIFMPLKVEVEGSTDGKEYKTLGFADNVIDEHSTGAIRKDFVVGFKGLPLRFIRVKAINRKICPDWHNGKGKPAFIFTDEITIE